MATKSPVWHDDDRTGPDRLQLYRLLFEKNPQLMLTLALERGADGKVQDWTIRDINPALLSLVDIERDQLVGVPASRFFYTDSDLAFLQGVFNEVAETGTPRQLERFLKPFDRTILFTIQRLDEDLLLATGVDISDYKALNRSLTESQRQLEFITAAAQVGLWNWDIEHDVTMWNDQCKRLFGLPLDAEVNYEVFLGTLHPDERSRVGELVRMTLEEREDFDVEFRIVLPDGSQRWIHSKGRAFYDTSEKPVQLSGVTIDVTRRRQAEIEREQVTAEHELQNELLEKLVQEAPVGIAMLEGPEYRFLLANPAYRQLIDGEIDPIGKRVAEIWPEAVDLVTPILDRVYESGVVEQGVDAPFPLRRGGVLTIAYLTYTVTPLFTAAHEIGGAVVLVQDNTAQVLARKQVELEQSRLETFVSNAPVGILLVDEEGRMVRANPVAEQLFDQPLPYGQPFERLKALGIRWTDGSPANPRDLPVIRSALDAESFKNVELLVDHVGGTKIILASSAPILNPEGKVNGAVAVFQDVTDRMRAVAQIEVQHYLVQSREMERLQIAHQLHEGLLQDLIGLQFRIEETLSPQSTLDETHREQLEGIRRALAGQIRDLRDYCYNLRPPALTPFGLEKAIRSHVESIREKHPELSVHLDLLPDMQFLPEAIRLALFRVYQEVITNVIHHSGADNVWIRFVFNKREATLEIRDDGAGFRVPNDWVEAVRAGQLGLAAAQERVEAVSGQMQISSRSGEGTTIKVKVPLVS